MICQRKRKGRCVQGELFSEGFRQGFVRCCHAGRTEDGKNYQVFSSRFSYFLYNPTEMVGILLFQRYIIVSVYEGAMKVHYSFLLSER